MAIRVMVYSERRTNTSMNTWPWKKEFWGSFVLVLDKSIIIATSASNDDTTTTTTTTNK